MAAMEANLPESFVRNVKAEPKKAIALALLVAILATMWAKIFLFGDTTPPQAVANPGGRTPTGTSGTSNSGMPVGSRTLVKWTLEPITGTKRNLFAIKLDYFPVDGSRPIFTGDDGDGFWEQLAKSLAAKADQEKAKGILLENLRLRASRLDLQSTVITDGKPKAMVNGTLVQEGDTIEGFRIVRIEAKRIVVEAEGQKIEVNFKH
jgi:type II secretion system (T2SS) protein B